MLDINRLREKASALGFSFQRGTRKGAGYVLVNDANGDKPLGDTYAASLDDVERYLDSFADDAGIEEVEIGSGEPSKPPPTQAEMRKSLQGHPNAGAIKGVLQPQSETRDEQRQRIGLDHLVLSVVTPAQRAAFDRLPEEEKQAYFAKVKAATAAEEKRKADKLPKQVTPLRESGINPDHPFAKEKARQSRVFADANRKLRTNRASEKDRNDDEYQNYGAYFDGQETDEEAKRAENISFLPPEAGAYNPTPKPAVEFKGETRRPRLSRSELQMRREASAIGDLYRKNLLTELGRKLANKQASLDHGEWESWLAENEAALGFSRTTAWRFIKKAAKI